MTDVVVLLNELVAELRRHPGDRVAEAWVRHFTQIDRRSLVLWSLKHHEARVLNETSARASAQPIDA